MLTFAFSVLHFCIDGICAAALYARFSSGSDAAFRFLLYNFCAFVLQLPVGVILDRLLPRTTKKLPCVFAFAGSLLTLLGAFTSPVILGIGNAFFHVGGGVGTILEDRFHKSDGRRLGIFVARERWDSFSGNWQQKTGAIPPGCCFLTA